MGCASSKNYRCRHCEKSYSPITRRSFSMNVHHPPLKEGDSYHVVALTSSTLGSIKLDPSPNLRDRKWVVVDDEDDEVGVDKKANFTMGMIEAKSWSEMIDEKITRVVPKTPIMTPPGEPESINVGDLMEGLEETSPLRLRDHLRSFSFHVNSPERIRVHKDGFRSPNRTWFDAPDKENLISDAIVSDFDPELICAFRKALQELSPTNPFHIKAHDHDQDQEEVNNGVLEDHNSVNGIMELEVIEKKLNAIAPIDVTQEKERVILYFTSLRGVRKTYEDCCYVRLVLKGVGVRVDERDVSMHSGFKEELRDCLGEEGFKGGLPKVFVGEKYIGGVEEIRRMHEDGKLDKVLGGCEMLEDECGNLINFCEACGDIRFVPCETCSGSCKIYYEYEDDEQFEERDEYGFQRCPECNENGLVRCPICCY